MGLWPRPALYFYSRPPRGGRLERPDVLLVAFLISIHALREEGDIGRNPGYGIEDISIHALREEGDLWPSVWMTSGSAYFYPRPPRGGRLARGAQMVRTAKNFYPRPPRGGRLAAAAGTARYGLISIHALREEGDVGTYAHLYPDYTISIHALREEGDMFQRSGAVGRSQFLSTPSARRATRGAPRNVGC